MLTDEALEELFLTHLDIKRWLTKVIQMEEPVDANSVRADNQCKLGDWIYGDGMQFAKTAEYQALRDSHAEFHEHAYQALKLYSTGNYSEALRYVNSGPFEDKSKGIKIALSNMRSAVKAAVE